MSDNRTTELLRKLLEERGIDWSYGDASYEIEWNTPDGRHCSAMYWKPTFTVLISGCTPEQAIAATLGSEREKRLEKLVRIYGEIGNYFCERFACCDAEFASCKYCIGLPQGGQCELGWCNDESKALGIEQPDYGGGECEPVNLEELYDRIGELENELAERGVLTAEQVREAIEKRFDFDVWVPAERWQAIADELNAELGSGTCKITATDNRTTELLKDYVFTLRRLEYDVDKPGSNMTLGEYEAEEKRVTDEYAQAIAATLRGRTCELHDCEGSFSAVNKSVWRCDCGAFMTQYTDATTYHKPRYCPNCGRKSVG